MFQNWQQGQIKRSSSVKGSVVKKLKALAIKNMPRFEEIVDELLPGKVDLTIHHLDSHVALYSLHREPFLIETDKGLVFPYLKIAIEYPGLVRSVYCYDEAVVAVLRGASLMARGTWGTDETYKKGDVVQLCLAGQEIPFAIGIMEMSGEQIAERPDGPAVTVLHLLGDGLWRTETLW
jgi:PUA domain protein